MTATSTAHLSSVMTIGRVEPYQVIDIIKAPVLAGAFLLPICNRRGAVANGSVEYRSLGEDMPRKPVCKRLTGHPLGKGKEAPAFPALRRGRVRAAPAYGSRDASLAGFGVESRGQITGMISNIYGHGKAPDHKAEGFDFVSISMLFDRTATANITPSRNLFIISIFYKLLNRFIPCFFNSNRRIRI